MTVLALDNPWPLLTATAGLVAFHIGLYTLVGRERKSPFVINDLFPVFLLCLLVTIVTVLAFFLSIDHAKLLLSAATLIFLTALIWSFVVVYRTTMRLIYFVDRISIFHMPLMRQLKRIRLRTSQKPTYSHNALPVDDGLVQAVFAILGGYSPDFAKSSSSTGILRSIAIQVEKLSLSKEILIKLSSAFLRSGNYVQYVTVATHPIDFIECLQAELGRDWQKIAPNVIAIDAYSRHFAFLDSIYAKKDIELDRSGVRLIKSKRTYAGIHSASSAAFKQFKTDANSESRKPTLVIYEFTSALTDLESIEQFRIFLRHVIPSERLWGGMLTVFIDTGLGANEWKLMRAYSDIAGEAKAIPTLENQQ